MKRSGGQTTLPHSRSPEIALVGLVVVIAVALRVPTLSQPLVEHNAFRQTQTAYTALLYHRDGINLLHPKLPVLGPPFEVPFEFPLFQAIAALVMNLGVTPDLAARITGLACFVVTAVLLWGLIRRLAGPVAAAAGLLFFLFTPFALVWSRTSMIEYLATAGAVGSVWAGMAWRDNRWPWMWAVALVAGVTAALVKIPTSLFWTLPLLAYRSENDDAGIRGWLRARLDPLFVVLLVVPVAAAVLWTWHADAIKASNPATWFLTSQALQTWNFGTVAQRLDPATWLRIARRIGLTLVGVPFAVLLPFAIAKAVRSPQPLCWVAIGLAGALPIGVFFNLYVVHDYYLAAISPAIAAVLGLGMASLWNRASTARHRSLLIVAALGAAAVTAVQTSYYWTLIYHRGGEDDQYTALPLARELAASSQPGDLVVVAGRDWSSDILYHSRRTGLMMAPNVDPGVIARLPTQGYRIFASWDPERDAISVLRNWPWTGVLGPRTYVMGQTLHELRGARLVAGDDLNAFKTARAHGRALRTEPVVVPCGKDAGQEIPTGASGTWLRLRTDAVERETRVYIARGLGPVPVRAVLALKPDAVADRGPLKLWCSGGGSVTVEEVADAPAPSTAPPAKSGSASGVSEIARQPARPFRPVDGKGPPHRVRAVRSFAQSEGRDRKSRPRRYLKNGGSTGLEPATSGLTVLAQNVYDSPTRSPDPPAAGAIAG
jgi:hypothetical protein